MASPETRRMVMAAAGACEDKKALDTRILELDPADSAFTDFFLITSGANERQTLAIADEIDLRIKRDFGTLPTSVEGRKQGEWVLMDYIDFVVHIFVAEKRAFYNIERLRKSARTVELTELKALLAKKTSAARKAPAKKLSAKAPKKAAVVRAKKSATKAPGKSGAKSPGKSHARI